MNSGIAGVDEAGVGSLMGSMTAGAVVLPVEFDKSGLCDSKKMTEKTRKIMYEKLMKEAYVGIGVITNHEIDQLGMARCRRLVFHRALDDLLSKHDINMTKIIVDGTLFDAYKNILHECMPKADTIVPEVSAASIIAKHYRDTQVLTLCEQQPDIAERYDWKKNKGYPAPKHLAGLKLHGIVEHHRKSYGPCKAIE